MARPGLVRSPVERSEARACGTVTREDGRAILVNPRDELGDVGEIREEVRVLGRDGVGRHGLVAFVVLGRVRLWVWSGLPSVPALRHRQDVFGRRYGRGRSGLWPSEARAAPGEVHGRGTAVAEQGHVVVAVAVAHRGVHGLCPSSLHVALVAAVAGSVVGGLCQSRAEMVVFLVLDGKQIVGDVRLGLSLRSALSSNRKSGRQSRRPISVLVDVDALERVFGILGHVAQHVRTELVRAKPSRGKTSVSSRASTNLDRLAHVVRPLTVWMSGGGVEIGSCTR